MMIATGRFDGKQVILDTVPKDLTPDTRVRVTIEPESKPTGLAAIANLEAESDLPPDFAAQHHHYQYGVPKR